MNVNVNPFSPIGIQRERSFKTQWPPQAQDTLTPHDEVLAYSALDQARCFFQAFASIDNKEGYLYNSRIKDVCPEPGKIVGHHPYEGKPGSVIVNLNPEGKLTRGIYLSDDDQASLRCNFDSNGEPLLIERVHNLESGSSERLLVKINAKTGTLTYQQQVAADHERSALSQSA